MKWLLWNSGPFNKYKRCKNASMATPMISNNHVPMNASFTGLLLSFSPLNFEPKDKHASKHKYNAVRPLLELQWNPHVFYYVEKNPSAKNVQLADTNATDLNHPKAFLSPRGLQKLSRKMLVKEERLLLGPICTFIAFSWSDSAVAGTLTFFPLQARATRHCSRGNNKLTAHKNQLYRDPISQAELPPSREKQVRDTTVVAGCSQQHPVLPQTCKPLNPVIGHGAHGTGIRDGPLMVLGGDCQSVIRLSLKKTMTYMRPGKTNRPQSLPAALGHNEPGCTVLAREYEPASHIRTGRLLWRETLSPTPALRTLP